MSPESQRPPEDSRPMGTWQMHPHLVHEGVVPPAHLAGRRLDLQRSSGTRVLVDPRVEVVASAPLVSVVALLVGIHIPNQDHV